jgi:hypothetical protein
MKEIKVNNLYGYSVVRPDAAGIIYAVIPPLWKRLWYSFISTAYEIFLLSVFALCFTIAMQPKAFVGLIYYLVGL